MKPTRGPLAPRTTTRAAEPTKSSESFGPLHFDFSEHAPRPKAAAAVLPRSFAGVKRAILRWLEKEL